MKINTFSKIVLVVNIVALIGTAFLSFSPLLLVLVALSLYIIFSKELSAKFLSFFSYSMSLGYIAVLVMSVVREPNILSAYIGDYSLSVTAFFYIKQILIIFLIIGFLFVARMFRKK